MNKDTRMAFETNGRFGGTPVVNKVIIEGSDASMFVSVLFALRDTGSTKTGECVTIIHNY